MTAQWLIVNPYGQDRHRGADPGYTPPAPVTVTSVHRACECCWHKNGPDPWRLTHLNRICPLHGWVEAPAGTLGAILARAARVNVPDPMHAPIRRLRHALDRQRDRTAVRAGTVDVRALAIWISDVWCPAVLFEPIATLHDLIDWKADPYDPSEEDAVFGR